MTKCSVCNKEVGEGPRFEGYCSEIGKKGRETAFCWDCYSKKWELDEGDK